MSQYPKKIKLRHITKPSLKQSNFSVKDLKVNGGDVMEILKIKPGRKVGEVLGNIFKEVEEKPELNKREISHMLEEEYIGIYLPYWNNI